METNKGRELQQQMINAAWRQEEFKALRAEILANQESQRAILVFGTSALAAVLGFVYSGNEAAKHRPDALIMVQCMSLGFAYLFLRCALSTERIGHYIKHQYESHLDKAISWETYLRISGGRHETSTGGTITLSRPFKNAVQRSLEFLTTLPFLSFNAISYILIRRESNTTSLYSYSSLAVLLVSIITILYHLFSLLNDDNLETDAAARTHVLAERSKHRDN